MYTLMRANYNRIEKTIILDLYDHENKKGVELHYNLFSKKVVSPLIDILNNLIFKTLDLNTWDAIVQPLIIQKVWG